MNSLVDFVNRNISEVINEIDDKRLQMFAYDVEPADKARSLFVTEHFCESDEVPEPQTSDQQRPQLLFVQYQSPENQFQDEPLDASLPVSVNNTDTLAIIDGFLESMKDPSLQVNPEYRPLTENDFKLDGTEDDDVSARAPYIFARVFHPTRRGHKIIATGIYNTIVSALQGLNVRTGITTLVRLCANMESNHIQRY
jgi:hypothetical protein